MGGIEYSRVNLSYIDKPTGQETFVACKELGSSQIIPEGPLAPGDLFTVGFDPTRAAIRSTASRSTATPGGGRFNLVGTTGKGIKESARMAYDYLKANARKIGIDRDCPTYDLNLQVMSLMQGKDANDLGVAFFIALISAFLAARSLGDWWSWAR